MAKKNKSFSLIKDIYPDSKNASKRAAQNSSADQVVSNPGVSASFFDEVPTNVLPAPSLLITPFLDSIMKKRTVVVESISSGSKRQSADEETLCDEDMKSDHTVPKIDRQFLASLFV